VPGRDPVCYSEHEPVNIHVLNEAPVIENPKVSGVDVFDGLTETVVLVSSDYEMSPCLILR
jgi:hypothetical protein